MDELAKRVANLSPAKRALLEQKLKQNTPNQNIATTEPTSSSDDNAADIPLENLSRRVANLSPAKRALLEDRLKRLGGSTSSQSGESRLSLANVVRRVANLSPAKQNLLRQRIKKKITASLQPKETDSSSEALAQRVANLSPAKRSLLEKKLKKKPEDTLPSPPADLQMAEDAQLDDEQPSPAKSSTITPSLAEMSVEQQSSTWLDSLNLDINEAPSWLDDVELAEEDVQTETESETVLDETALESKADELVEAQTTIESKPGWIESLTPTDDEVLSYSHDTKTAEATGMLAGISTLLPAEKMATPTTTARGDGLQAAAQMFQAIATETPKPIVIPAPITSREQFVGALVKASLLALFVLIIALPLIPGLQRVINDNPVPWTEPTGAKAKVLDGQQRQLISEQLGIIDSRPPGSVALVSFDYSTATQGELQPLAEAVIGRLKGQGMRVIAVSLEPEGAVIAQNTLETILAEREQPDDYGVEVINLGFLPGQAAAVRNLIVNPDSLAERPDFKNNVALQNISEWEAVQNLEQVDIVITFADNPATARWWIEQLQIAGPPATGERFLLAATSAAAEPFLRPYRESNQLNGLISGINGAAAVEAGRNRFGPGRQMIDSVGIATLIVVILIAVGTVIGWMPTDLPEPTDQPEPIAQDTTVQQGEEQ